MASFEAETAVETDPTTRDLADRVASHFGDMFDRHIAAGIDTAPPYDPLGFLVAGYSESVGEVFEVTRLRAGRPDRRVLERREPL